MSSIVKFEGLWGVGEESPHCYLLTIDDFTFLLDCGWDEKFDKDYIDRLNQHLPRIDCILISYGDPLHMGALPYIIGKCQLSVPVYATIPVFKMGELVMYDWFLSHQNYEDFEHFDLDDVDATFSKITQVKYNQSIAMRGSGIGLSISAQPAGHMIGGSLWRISRDGEEDIVYAVDFNHKKERHLGGCELDKLGRPSLFIMDAFNANYRQERRRQRDEKFVACLQETCRTGGNVLVACDTGGRVLEMIHMLEQMWSTKESGLATYPLAFLSNIGYHVLQASKQMVEWMSDKLIKSFDLQRTNPFACKHLKICHTMADLNRLPSPKVVLATFPDLECGFARELFIQWAVNPKNTIILTSRTGPGTLARKLIDNPEIRTFKLLEKQRKNLEGDELEAFMKKKLKEHKVRIKEELFVDSDESEGENDVEFLEADQYDVAVVDVMPGTQQLLRSKKHHPMYPYHEEKIRGDDYGEFINLDDYDGENKEENKENIETKIKPFYDEDFLEVTEAPTKCISHTVTVRIAAQVLFIDFEGRSDGESVLKLMEGVRPHCIILVRGFGSDLHVFGNNLRTLTRAKVFAPKLGDVIDASMETHIYQLRLEESLMSSLLLQPTAEGKEVEVAWVNGRVTYQVDKEMEEDVELEIQEKSVNSAKPRKKLDIPYLKSIPVDETVQHKPVFVNEIRLSDFKQILSREGINSEFNAGVLWCANGTVALRRQDTGSMSIEGCLSEEYFHIQEILHSQYAIL